jgi:LuxR family transcriptional regulator, maltose regulon positive regulatory protein
VTDAGRADDPLSAGRAALAQGAWQDARAHFERALADDDRPDALEGLSWAAWWLEDVPACLEARERAYRRYQQQGDRRAAARMALWLGDDHAEFHGMDAVADGWFRRAARILADLDHCPEHGWLAVFEAHAALGRHELAESERFAQDARRAGRRHGAVDLEMFALATLGVIQVERGQVHEGMRCLDEATAAALSGEYDNLVPAAWSCCLLMATCEKVRDYERGAQWCRKVESFSQRMDARFVTGVCRAHYGAILTWQGDWGGADRELSGALRDLSVMRPTWRTEALVRLADLRRGQGRRAEAEELYAQVPAHPLSQRGMAALSLADGDPLTARDLLERALRQVPPESTVSRSDALELLIRADVALDDAASAASHLAELRAIALAVPARALHATVAFCEALVANARGDHEEASDRFEDAVDLYAHGGAPLEAARARVELAVLFHTRGRHDAAAHEARLALRALSEVGAAADVARARAVLERADASAGTPAGATPVLTDRQVEVLRLVAEGLTDQAIAARLTLSEHTVHRHVANVFTRLDCTSRAAAVAQASRLGLL